MSKGKYELKVELREEFGKNCSRRYRRQGLIPAVIYSREKGTQHIVVPVGEWGAIAKHDVHLVELKSRELNVTALIKDVQSNALKRIVEHIDFQEIRMDEVITASVRVHALPGDPIGLADGGILEQPMHEIAIKCLPGNLPEAIYADISHLDIEQSLHVRDMVMPEGVTAAEDPDAIVFHVMRQSLEEPAAATTVAEGEESAAANGEEETKEKDSKDNKDSKDGKDKK